MLLEVLHDTHYTYASPVQVSQHQLHLSLRSTPWQQVLSQQLQLSLPAPLRASRDPFGNERHFFDLEHAHDRLSICSRSIVHTHQPQPAPHLDLQLPWEQVREHFVYRAGQTDDAASDFLYASPLVPCTPDLAAYARTCFPPQRPLLEACMELCLRIHEDFAYAPESTSVETSAAQALAARRGVCQDFTHVMVACCRSLGLPARYVSGYLLTQPPPGQPRLIGADASHAWAEVYVPAPDTAPGLSPGQWMGFCPTNARTPGEDFVVLGWGRDFTDVSPVRGVVQGGGQHQLKVQVTVRPVDADWQPIEPTDLSITTASAAAAPTAGATDCAVLSNTSTRPPTTKPAAKKVSHIRNRSTSD